MASTVTDLVADTWTKVLTNVTYEGSVHIIDIASEPTYYEVALVDTGNPAPATDFGGGIVFKECFSPANSVASDYYVRAKDRAGKVVVLT